MAVLMLIVCISENHRLYMDKWFGVYLVFIAMFGVSSIITGHPSQFIHRLIGYYFVAYVGYWATIVLLRKYNGHSFLVNLIVIIGLFDVFITYGQFFNIPAIKTIPSYIGINIDTEFLDSLGVGDEAYGIALPGIMATDVYNGYFLMTVGLFSLFYLRRGFSIIRFIPWIVSFAGSFMVQQRAPFYLLLLFSAFVFFKVLAHSNNRFKLLFVIVFLAATPFIADSLFDYLLSGETRFSIGFDSTSRDVIYRESLNFINEHFFLGGFFDSGLAPHNQFLSAWIMGGLIGLLSIIWITLDQSVSAIRLLLSKLSGESFVFVVSSAALLGFILNSMLHNAGIANGDILYWIIWGFICEVKPVNLLTRVNTYENV